MYFGNFSDKINRKLDIIIQHILQSKNRNEGNNNTQLENVEFCQLQTKEEFDALEKSLAEDAKKREQLVSINTIFTCVKSIESGLCQTRVIYKCVIYMCCQQSSDRINFL